MNILVPDIWLREYLKTKATPSQLKEYLSLCGPSIERIYGTGKDTVYDIEITGNRPDAMSVMGVAREAATILPRFGIAATLAKDPYKEKVIFAKVAKPLPLTLKTDSGLNPRWMSIIFDNVSVKTSPAWLRNYLELAGMRSINTVVDITNFLMRGLGQPAHVFDYDAIEGHTMTLRASKKGETLITLDGKKHTLPGGDIVIEDKSGKLIDLCGIMGGENSSVTEKTKRVILFVQTYHPLNIRKTSMALGHRTEAAGLFEKGLDTELVKPAFAEGIRLMREITGATIVSNVTDIYPSPYKPGTVTVSRKKIDAYIGILPSSAITAILTSLGFGVSQTKEAVTVTVPSYRRDVAIDVDVIEEIARVHGYHAIPSVLPPHAPPVTIPDPALIREEQLKIRLRDWGYTETYTYSMLSQAMMDMFSLDTTKAYTIANPLSSEWVYMRPSLVPSVLTALKANSERNPQAKLFELSMCYLWKAGDLPKETPMLAVATLGNTFYETKGIAEAIFDLIGIPFPHEGTGTSHDAWFDPGYRLPLGEYGIVGVLHPKLCKAMGFSGAATMLVLDMHRMGERARVGKTYVPVPKYPSVHEDLSFIVPERFTVAPLMRALETGDPLVRRVTLLDTHEHTRTLHIEYQDPENNLTTERIVPVREKLIRLAEKQFGVTLKTK